MKAWLLWPTVETVSLEVLFMLLEDVNVAGVLAVSAFWVFFALGLVLFLVGDVPFEDNALLVVLSSLLRLEAFPFSMWGLDADLTFF